MGWTQRVEKKEGGGRVPTRQKQRRVEEEGKVERQKVPTSTTPTLIISTKEEIKSREAARRGRGGGVGIEPLPFFSFSFPLRSRRRKR